MSEELLEKSKALFIRRWGEMGAAWGISRTMAEIHALMYVAPEPLCTDDVMKQLQVSRGNASMNLRQLLDWGLIYRVHQRGDRKEYFIAETDVWQVFETIARERRRREVQPVVDTIRQCREMIDEADKAHRCDEMKVYHERLKNMENFLGTMHNLLNLVLKVKSSGFGKLTRTISKIAG
jgi:DNA-binding transcriptional regulator GbsR (MarR family)